jgi:hypothetical protein
VPSGPYVQVHIRSEPVGDRPAERIESTVDLLGPVEVPQALAPVHCDVEQKLPATSSRQSGSTTTPEQLPQWHDGRRGCPP